MKKRQRSTVEARWTEVFRGVGIPILNVSDGTHDPHSVPWILVGICRPPRNRNDADARRMWRRRTRHAEQRILKLLEAFYGTRPAGSLDVRLVVRSAGSPGSFRIDSYGSDALAEKHGPERFRLHQQYWEELDRFTEYLRLQLE